jgi:putative hydrolase of the HAD superfamily
MIKAVLFDMYRTLGEDVNHASFLHSLHAHGLSEADALHVLSVADTDAFDGAEHYEASADRDQYNSWRRTHLLQALRDAGITAAVAETIVDQYGSWKVGMLKAFQPYPETRSALQTLHDMGLRVAVCSNWDWDIDHIIEELGVMDLVDAIFSSAQIGVRKPHPAFFHRILDKLELGARETLFVGDTWETDIAGAVGVGMRSVWIDRRHRVAPEEHPEVTRVDTLSGVVDVVSAASS